MTHGKIFSQSAVRKLGLDGEQKGNVISYRGQDKWERKSSYYLPPSFLLYSKTKTDDAIFLSCNSIYIIYV